PLRDTEERAHTQGRHLLPAEHGDLETVCPPDFASDLHEIIGRAEITGHHGEPPGQIVSTGDGGGDGDTTIASGGVVDVDRRARQRSTALLRWRRGLEVSVFPTAESQPGGDLLDLG